MFFARMPKTALSCSSCDSWAGGGDGFQSSGEECDDGNFINSDDCSIFCHVSSGSLTLVSSLPT